MQATTDDLLDIIQHDLTDLANLNHNYQDFLKILTDVNIALADLNSQLDNAKNPFKRLYLSYRFYRLIHQHDQNALENLQMRTVITIINAKRRFDLIKPYLLLNRRVSDQLNQELNTPDHQLNEYVDMTNDPKLFDPNFTKPVQAEAQKMQLTDIDKLLEWL